MIRHSLFHERLTARGLAASTGNPGTDCAAPVDRSRYCAGKKGTCFYRWRGFLPRCAIQRGFAFKGLQKNTLEVTKTDGYDFFRPTLSSRFNRFSSLNSPILLCIVLWIATTVRRTSHSHQVPISRLHIRPHRDSSRSQPCCVTPWFALVMHVQ